MSTATASALIGPFYPIRVERLRRISTSPEFTDPEHNPMIPHVIVLEPGLVIFKIYNGLLVFWSTEHRRATARLAWCVEEMPAGLGQSLGRS